MNRAVGVPQLDVFMDEAPFLISAGTLVSCLLQKKTRMALFVLSAANQPPPAALNSEPKSRALTPLTPHPCS